MSTFNFHHFRAQFGEQGATERFEDFVVRCVDATRSNVRSMRAQGGDWGIDAFVGELDGELVIWQAKFFLDGLGTPQRRQVEESLASALKQAAQRDHTVAGWTLCLPIDLSPQERTWWARFAKQREKAHGIPIQLWERLDFERMMGMPECANVRAEYFPQLRAIHAPAPPAVQAPPDGTVFDEMLFVAQLRAAGMAELDSAKEQFYNAEVLTREAGDRELRARIDALDGLRADLRSTWEDRFNAHCATCSEDDGRLPELHPDVMARIEQAHLGAPAHPLPLTLTHRKGAMHQVVDRARAGWVRHYRQIVDEHQRSS